MNITMPGLPGLPDGAELLGVTAEPTEIKGRAALRVTLDPRRRAGVLGSDFGDEPTFVLLPHSVRDGVIEVDVLSRLLPDAPDYARGFIGLAYRVQDQGNVFESVYLRPLNGSGLNPLPPRSQRAVQYFAYPDWKFDRLREIEPNGGYEAAADILPDRWIRLRLEFSERRVAAFADGKAVLRLNNTKLDPSEGRIGLWVDIGTDGYFANFRLERI